MDAPPRAQRLLDWLLPERALDPAARAEFDEEARALNLSRARGWGAVLLTFQAVPLGFTARVPVATVAERLWQRDLIRLYVAIELCDAFILLCVALDRGPARAVARRAGPLFQAVALLVYALMAVNAQRLHGAVGPFLAIAVATPFLFRASTAWFSGLLTASAAVVVAGVVALQTAPSLRSANVITVLGFSVAGLVIARIHAASLVQDLRNRRALRRFNEELESRVEEQTRELRRFAMRLDEVLEVERRRLAGELHDDLGQELTAMRFEVEALRAHAPEGAQREGLLRMAAALDRSHLSVRTILESLRPRILDEEGLEESIRWLARHFRERTGRECAVEVVLYDEPDPGVGLVAFRIAQEALTNVARHAGAARAWVSLAGDGDALRLEVADDGPARDAPIAPGRGMTGMLERAMSLGGTVDVDARSPRGTRVRATLPLRPARAVA